MVIASLPIMRCVRGETACTGKYYGSTESVCSCWVWSKTSLSCDLVQWEVLCFKPSNERG